MPSNAEEVLRKYYQEDPSWNLDVLHNWLTVKKGIPSNVAEHAIKKGILTLEGGRVIESHHGMRGFDQFVLGLAHEIVKAQSDYVTQLIDADIKQGINDHLDGYKHKIDSRIDDLEELMLNSIKDTWETFKLRQEGVNAQLNDVNRQYEELLAKNVDRIQRDYDRKLDRIKWKFSGGRLRKIWRVLIGII
jgi:hypothetical protein